MVNQRELTEEGLEKNFATNTLGKIFLVVPITAIVILLLIPLFLDALFWEYKHIFYLSKSFFDKGSQSS